MKRIVPGRKTFGSALRDRMYVFWRKSILAQVVVTSVVGSPTFWGVPFILKAQTFSVPLPNLDSSFLTHSPLSSPPPSALLLPVFLPDAMNLLEEDNRTPPVDSMDTERHSAERWPPDTSPPQNVRWVKSQRIPCTSRTTPSSLPLSTFGWNVQRQAICWCSRHFKMKPPKTEHVILTAFTSAPFEE